MNRRDFSTRLALSTLAGAIPGLAMAQGGPLEGRHYQKLGTPVPVAPGKIEVVEFFWYGCPHCYAFEPVVENWTKQLPADVGFRRSHVAFRENTKTHQRSFFALEALGREAEFRPKIFNAIHQQRQPLDTADSMAAFLGKNGLEAPKFLEVYNSFSVQSKCQQAVKLSEAYRIDGVPAIGVGGRFLTSPSMAGQGAGENVALQQAVVTASFLIERVRSGKV
ncbi:thiol:disulfide interchange protein DsbA/DsbL [Roseateles toxinivorans]|uniref:Thiol:disulfide interchange protein n=1 Tax=Roseateles toxinivorans TaxID=270368 RepID=A0A4R6QSE5_9BURK|nr:thiol:disulfide interchange protein DsbA/DsbL [Roseateles toxinivorans]TDP73185.1 thiol:disulfide interchange protein DsbA [Roseateles toxinivorans]